MNNCLSVRHFEFTTLLLVVTAAWVGCSGPADPRVKVSQDDPRVVLMLHQLQKVDRLNLGLTPIPIPLPQTTDIRLEPSPRGADANLHLSVDGVARTVQFRKTPDGYLWIGEMEVHAAPGQQASWGHPPQEMILISYQVEPINKGPTNQIQVVYFGSDTNLAGRLLTLADVRPILAEWKQRR